MTRARWRAALWIGTFALALGALWGARAAMLPFAVGAVLAYALTPLVDRLAQLVPARTRSGDVIRRGVAVAVIYLLFFGSITAVGFILIPIAVTQIGQFVTELPGIALSAQEEVAGWLEEYHRRVPPEVQQRVNGVVGDAAVTIAQATARGAETALTALTQTVGLLFGFAILPFWMFYVLRDRYFIAANVMRAVPKPARDDVRNVKRITDHLLGRYIRGQLLLGLVVGVAVGLLMTVMGVQLSLGLGLWAGVTELIPIVGPWLGAVPALIIVGATRPDLLAWVAFVYFIVQQIENNLLVPRIQGNAVDLHPAMIILLLATAGAVWGFVGLVVAIPLAAILRELLWYADRRLRGRTPAQALGASAVGGHQEDRPMDARIDGAPGDSAGGAA